MNDDRIHESVIELVPSSVSPCDCCSRISISLNLSDYEITVGCYDEFDVLDSCGMLPFERNAYRLKLNTNSIRKPSSIESDFSSHDQGTFKRDSSLNFEDILGYERSEIIVLIVFVIFLLVVNCISPLLARLSLIHYLNVTVMGLSIAYIGFVLFQMCDLPSGKKVWSIITFCLFFDGIFMCYTDSKYGTGVISGLYGMISFDSVILFIVGLCQKYDELRGRSSYETEDEISCVCCGRRKDCKRCYMIVLIAFMFILLYLNRLAPLIAHLPLIDYFWVSLLGLGIYFVVCMMFLSCLHVECITVWMTISFSLFCDGIAMVAVAARYDSDVTQCYVFMIVVSMFLTLCCMPCCDECSE